jgi:hypothetical protein
VTHPRWAYGVLALVALALLWWLVTADPSPPWTNENFR